MEFKKQIEAAGEYFERYWDEENKPILIDWLDKTNIIEYQNWLKKRDYDSKTIEKRIEILNLILDPYL